MEKHPLVQLLSYSEVPETFEMKPRILATGFKCLAIHGAINDILREIAACSLYHADKFSDAEREAILIALDDAVLTGAQNIIWFYNIQFTDED